jgi:membrane peptidoglycan carboxypeptidase
MGDFVQASMKIGGGNFFGRLAFAFLLLCSIAFGAAVGLLFVYTSDLPEIRALEDYRPNVVTELYADDGQLIGTFALQRRILLTYEQIPKVLRDAILSTEDQHFEEHWGVDFPRVVEAAWRNIIDDAVGSRAFSEPGQKFSSQGAGDGPRHPDRTPLYESADFHDVLQSDLSGPRQLRL